MKETNFHAPVTSIVVAGGGAAGWLTAAILASEHNVRHNDYVTVTLVESPDVRILGVGEGTWPTMRDTLRKIGIDERTLLLACDASFKQGTRFVNWKTATSSNVYDHPFSLPAGFFEGSVGAWWLSQTDHSQSPAFSNWFSTQTSLCDAAKAPKQLQTPPYAAVANYGYHLDAHKFAELLKTHCIKNLGVNYISDHIEHVEEDTDGFITELRCKSHDVHGDLFIDCTGFSATLIGKHFNSPMTDVSGSLKNDSAIAVQAAYVNEEVDIASATISTAHKNGWVWDIGLPHRKGVGCVYSSEFANDDTAIETLKQYLHSCPKTQAVSESDFRKITFSPGYRKAAWVKNCVAIGTSAGFVEPLEASALVMVEMSARFLSEHLPNHRVLMPAVSKSFNRSFSRRWERIHDFLKLHYVLSDRQDSPYWRFMTDLDHASEQLNDWLLQWQFRPVSMSDFCFADELFPAASYMYVLYGMKAPEQFAINLSRYSDSTLSRVQRAVNENEKLSQKHLAMLPTNRELINTIRASSFS
ncbi:tryptophan halogenase family protein [Alteromonas gracilis]|uniref:tryptophan halogenase family protein n=1 Tax=Alteromonas gracilis TaxID=1479524 RepID=UPI003734CBC1